MSNAFVFKKGYLTVYLLVNKGSKTGTKHFASLSVGVCKADKIGLKGGQPSTHFLCTLQETIHYSRSGSHWFHMFRVFSDRLLGSTSFL